MSDRSARRVLVYGFGVLESRGVGGLRELSYLLGIAVGSLGTLVAMRFSRTRFAQWVVHLDSYFETMNYPMVGESDEQ